MNKYSTAIEMIKDINIIDLKNIIKNVYNIEANFELKADAGSFEIISNNLVSQTGSVGIHIFDKIYLKIVCYNESYQVIKNDFNNNGLKNNYYFPINIRYEHTFGGSNGYSLGKGWIGYNFYSNSWEIVPNN